MKRTRVLGGLITEEKCADYLCVDPILFQHRKTMTPHPTPSPSPLDSVSFLLSIKSVYQVTLLSRLSLHAQSFSLLFLSQPTQRERESTQHEEDQSAATEEVQEPVQATGEILVLQQPQVEVGERRRRVVRHAR